MRWTKSWSIFYKNEPKFPFTILEQRKPHSLLPVFDVRQKIIAECKNETLKRGPLSLCRARLNQLTLAFIQHRGSTLEDCLKVLTKERKLNQVRKLGCTLIRFFSGQSWTKKKVGEKQNFYFQFLMK